jgi:hypothetical protein
MALPIYDDDSNPYYQTPLGEIPPPPPRTPQNPQPPQNTQPPSQPNNSYPWDPTQNEETQTTDPSKPNYNPRDAAIDSHVSNWYDYLQMKAREFEAQYGWNPYHDSDLQGVIRNMSYEHNPYTDTQLLDNVLQNWAQRNDNTPGAGRGGSGGGGGSSYSGGLAPPGTGSGWMPTYTAPVFTPPAALNIPSWNAPAEFAAPTLEQARQEPGFAFAMEQGTKALEGSAASKGLLRTGGTMKELLGFGQRLGEQNYQNVYNRNLTTYGTNYKLSRDKYDTTVHEVEGEYDKAYQSLHDAWDAASRGAEHEFAPRMAEATANFNAQMEIWKEKMRIAGMLEQDSN